MAVHIFLNVSCVCSLSKGCLVIYCGVHGEIYSRLGCTAVIYHFHIISDSESMHYYAFSFSNRSNQILPSIK